MIKAFDFARIPKIVFGAGKFGQAPDLIQGAGGDVLIVTGGGSHRATNAWDHLLHELEARSIGFHHLSVTGEPSPELVDSAVAKYGDKGIKLVLSWGGGSVIDAGKAISAMLPAPGSVTDYLEGVGTRVHSGLKVPFIAVPTTSGTGSEATKNAVLSRIGPDGFKKSLRHDNFVPDVALLDPELMVSCPDHVSAACGMDAFTQLLESYVSTKASAMTDALAMSGMEAARDSLVPACTDCGGDVDARASMAFAALMSGMTLANAGLGVVHGIAGPLGGFFDIPHGVACGTLLTAAMEATMDKLMDRHGVEHLALGKFASVGGMLMGLKEVDTAIGCRMLIDKLSEWTEVLKMKRLGEFGIKMEDLDKIAAASGNKNNPLPLDQVEIKAVLQARL